MTTLKDTSRNKLQLLHQISNILTSTLNLKDTLSNIFSLLEDNISLKKGVLILRDTYTDEYYIEIGYGLTEKDRQKSVFKLLEILTIKVLESNQVDIIDDLTGTVCGITFDADEAMPGNSLTCLPIILGGEKMGTLSVVAPLINDPYDDRLSLLSTVCLLIAQEIKLKKLLELEKEALRRENVLLRDELKEKYNIHNMIGNSSAMHQVYESIIQVANSNATVLIRGESGTGKELVAHAIHYNSPRASKPFIKINCGAIPESLIESELFGYEKGAFTDAQESKMGKFEAANGGTIFLDEIGELAPQIQVKLLRVLQEKEIERIGALSSVKVNVRVITATHRDLEAELIAKRFREDLYYRLNVFPIFLPPLKERKTDILLLSEHFLDKFAKENSKKINRISSFAIDLLSSYHWPGNVRELENCMERAALVCRTDTIQATDLPPTLQRGDGASTVAGDLSYEELVRNFEKELIIDALKKTRGNKSKASELLKTTQRIIGYKIQNLNIDYNKYKGRV
jgi:Nif-specific regulatory protein